MVHSVPANSFNAAQLFFLKKALTPEGVTSLLITADRVNVSPFFILQKTMEFVNQESSPLLMQNLLSPPFPISEKLQQKFTQSIKKLLEFQIGKNKPVPLKKKQISKPTKQVKKSLPRSSSRKVRPLSKTITIHKSLLHSFCPACGDPLFQKQQFIGCYCIDEGPKKVFFQKSLPHNIKIHFAPFVDQEEQETILEILLRK